MLRNFTFSQRFYQSFWIIFDCLKYKNSQGFAGKKTLARRVDYNSENLEFSCVWNSIQIQYTRSKHRVLARLSDEIIIFIGGFNARNSLNRMPCGKLFDHRFTKQNPPQKAWFLFSKNSVLSVWQVEAKNPCSCALNNGRIRGWTCKRGRSRKFSGFDEGLMRLKSIFYGRFVPVFRVVFTLKIFLHFKSLKHLHLAGRAFLRLLLNA